MPIKLSSATLWWLFLTNNNKPPKYKCSFYWIRFKNCIKNIAYSQNFGTESNNNTGEAKMIWIFSRKQLFIFVNNLLFIPQNLKMLNFKIFLYAGIVPIWQITIQCTVFTLPVRYSQVSSSIQITLEDSILHS